MDTFIKIDKYGRKIRFVEIVCDNYFCKKLFQKEYRFFLRCYKHYCSTKCGYIGKTIEQTQAVICSWCGIEFRKKKSALKNSKSGLYFCCREHKDLAQRTENGLSAIWPSHYKNGEGTYRKKALKYLEHKCNRCDFAGDKRALHVHHIDRNRSNNNINNLEIICIRCHFLEHVDDRLEGLNKYLKQC